MNYLRRLSTRSLILVVVAVCVLAGGGAAIAVASGGGGPTPPPKPLDQAIYDALSAGHPAGMTAHIQFTNNLFPAGSLLGQVGSALMSGATGQVWVTGDGRGRAELHSGVGDVDVVWDTTQVSIYAAASNTVYRIGLPTGSTSNSADTPPALADIDKVLSAIGVHWALSGAQPTDIAGRPAYSVSASPKHDGGLLGSLQLAFDAANGTPLRLGIYAQGSPSPVLELTVTDISLGPVAASAVEFAPPAGAKVVEVGTPSRPDNGSSPPAVTGLAAVQAAAPFAVVAPDSLVGLPRRDVRLVGGDTVLALYGQGLGGIALVERKADSSTSASGLLSNLPTVSLDGLTAHELATQLGTVLTWQSGGTSFVLAGSLPVSAAETAARQVK